MRCQYREFCSITPSSSSHLTCTHQVCLGEMRSFVLERDPVVVVLGAGNVVGRNQCCEKARTRMIRSVPSDKSATLFRVAGRGGPQAYGTVVFWMRTAGAQSAAGNATYKSCRDKGQNRRIRFNFDIMASTILHEKLAGE